MHQDTLPHKAHRHSHTHAYAYTQRQTNTHRYRHTHTHTHTLKQKCVHTWGMADPCDTTRMCAHIQTHTKTNSKTHTQRHTHKDKRTHTKTETTHTGRRIATCSHGTHVCTLSHKQKDNNPQGQTHTHSQGQMHGHKHRQTHANIKGQRTHMGTHTLEQ